LEIFNLNLGFYKPLCYQNWVRAIDVGLKPTSAKALAEMEALMALQTETDINESLLGGIHL